MSFLKKAWAWLKRYWFVPVALKLLVIFMLIKRTAKNTRLVKAFKSSDTAHDKEVKALKAQLEKEKKEKEKAKAVHEHKLKTIEERFETDLSDLDEQKKEELVKLSDTDILKLSKELAKILGAEHVE